MSKKIVTSINRKRAIGLGLAVLLLAGVGCSDGEEDSPAPEDIVRVSTATKEMPELGKFLPQDVTGVILIRKGENESGSPTITPFTRDGQPKNLCGSDERCELITSPDALLRMVSTNTSTASTTNRTLSTITTDTSTTTTDTPGTCKVRDRRYACHKSGTYKNKRNWHQSPDTAIHRQCGSSGCV